MGIFIFFIKRTLYQSIQSIIQNEVLFKFKATIPYI